MSSSKDKNPKETLDELRAMVTTYAKQETVDPIKLLGQWLGFGFAGALAVGIGAFLLGLGALRGLQAISWFDDTFSWAPYLLMFVAFCLLIALTVRAMLKKPDLTHPDFGDAQ